MNKSNSAAKLLVIITVVIIGLIIALMFLNNAKNDGSGTTVAEAINIDGQPTIGDDNAPITIVEFGDFKCPACKSWGEMIYPQIEEEYINTGKAKFAFVNVLFHGEESQLGSLAAETVLKHFPEHYWTFHHALFQAQPSSQSHNEPWLTSEKVMELVSGIEGIDVEQFEASFVDKEQLAEVEKDNELVKQYNIQLTPSIMINDTILEDPFDYEAIKNTIEQKLEGM